MLERYQEIVNQMQGFIEGLDKRLLPVVKEVEGITGVSTDLAEIIDTLRKRVSENRTVTLGVIGQIKSGKSTLLNAMLFGEEVLPAAASPKTARLTVIKHSQGKPSARAHFYTKKDWEEIRQAASKEKAQLSAMDKIYSSIVEEATQQLGNQIASLLGQKREVDWQDLDDYVGARGKYSNLVKYVELFHPHPMLMDLTIVDTPGLNDPVRSREEETKKFLQQADAVIFLTNPMRFLDKSDLELGLRDLKKVGVAGLVLVASRMDQLDEREYKEFTEVIVPKISERAQRGAKDFGWGPLAREAAAQWFNQDNTVAVSAMAFMLGKKLLEDRKALDENQRFYMEKMRNNGWPVDDPEELIRRSAVEDLRKKLDSTIIAKKHEIIFAKPLNVIEAKVNEVAAQTENRLKETQENLEKAKQNVQALKEKMEKELEEFEEITEAVREQMEDIKETIQQEFLEIRSSIAVSIRRPSNISTPWIFRSGTIETLETEIELSARRELETVTEDLMKKYLSIKQKIRDRLSDIPFKGKQLTRIRKELSAVINSLFAAMEEDQPHIYVEVNLSYSILDKLFGKADAIAAGDVERACAEAEQRIVAVLKERNKKAERALYGFLSKLERKIEEMRSEREKNIQKLQADLDKGERGKEELEKRLNREMEAFRKLQAAFETTKKELAKLKNELEAGV